MNTQTSPLYQWLKQIPTALLPINDIPLLGNAPPFPWEAFKNQLVTQFQFQDLEISPEEGVLRTKDTLFDGLGSPCQVFPLAIAPLEGFAACFVSDIDMSHLLGILLGKDPSQLIGVPEDFKKTTTEFVVASLLQAFVKTGYDKQLSPRLVNLPFVEEEGWTQDIVAHVQGRQIRFRFFASLLVLQSWRQKYALRTLDFLKTTPRAQQIELAVHVEAGRTSLSLAEWRQVKTGDFLLLDSCSLTPYEEKKGRVLLTINGMPCFRAKLKPGGVKLLEHPLNYEVDTSMPDLRDDDPSFEHDDSTFGSFDESLENDETEESEHEGSFDENAESAEHATGSFSTHQDDDEDDETHSVEATLPAGKSALKPEDIMLPIIIELGRIQMPIQQLLELQPGNVLDLDLYPENGVDLVVNGKKIGKGEILKLGESLGVRILDIC